MKPLGEHIEISEDDLKDIDRIAAVLFLDENDPRSYNYKRVITRPLIKWWRILACCTLSIISVCVGCHVLLLLGLSLFTALTIGVGFALTIILMNLSRIIICLVRIYQRYMPDSIRNKCRFEPSCSEYMIQSVQKYGAFKGLKKGINRLSRCNISDGGFDYP